MSSRGRVLSEELQYKSFPLTPDIKGIASALGGAMQAAGVRGAPLSDNPALEQKLEKFAASSRPFVVTPLVSSLDEKGSKYLFFPAGPSARYPDESAYLVARFNGRNVLQLKEIDHLPFALKNKPQVFGSAPSFEQRLKLFIQNWEQLGRVLDLQHYSRKNINDISVLFNDDSLKNKAEKPTAALVMAMVSEGLIPLTAMRTVREVMIGVITSWMDSAREDFLSSIDPVAMESMAGLKGAQTAGIFRFLHPYAEREKKPAGEKKKGRALNEAVASFRREFLKEFPLAAASIENLKNHPAFEKLDRGESPEDVVRSLWKGKSTPPFPDTILKGLKKISPSDVGSSVASRFHEVAPFLACLPSVHCIPKTEEEWLAFESVTRADKRLSDCYFKLPGTTVRDCARALDEGTGISWESLADRIYFDPLKNGNTLLDTLLVMADRVGLSRLGPLAINMKKAGFGAHLDDHRILAACRVMQGDRKNACNTRAKKDMEETGLSLIATFYEDEGFLKILEKARMFRDGEQAKWDKERRQIAVSDAFAIAAGNRTWKALPEFPQGWNDDIPGFKVIPIGNAGEAVKFLTGLPGREVWGELEKVIYEPVHFIVLRNAYNGSAEGFVILEEVQGEAGDMKLAIARKGIFGKEGNEPERSNTIMEKINLYIEYINSLKLNPRSFEAARTSLRRAAEKLHGLPAEVGHDFKDFEKNVWAANAFEGSLPHRLRHIPDKPGSYNCPACEYSVYGLIGDYLTFIDPDSDHQPGGNRTLRLVQ